MAAEKSSIAGLVKDRSEYKEIRVLGKGACGVVYLAEDIAAHKRVAMKKLFTFAAVQDQRAFLREIQIPLEISSPAILPVEGFCLAENDADTNPALIITPFMPNGNLQDILKPKSEGTPPRPGFGPTEKSKVVFGVAYAMSLLHRHHVIHRDLKPDNVFLDDNFEPRVADFGLARFADQEARMTGSIGSPLFMAPELYSSDGPAYTDKVDVFAYAVLLYHLFSTEIVLDDGRPTKSPAQLLLRVMNGARLKLDETIPDAFQSLIRRCWSQKPEERMSFADVVKEINGTDQFCFRGTDMANYRAYKESLIDADKRAQEAPAKPAQPAAKRVPGPDPTETKPQPGKRFAFTRVPPGRTQSAELTTSKSGS
jgi:serine/threonine protein kinase